MKILRSLAATVGLIGSGGASASTAAYPFGEWAALWEETCGSPQAAYSVIDHPVEHGWANADLDDDEKALSIYESVQAVMEGNSDTGKITGLFLLRQYEHPERLAVFQELQYLDQPEKYLLACALYDFSAPDMSVRDLAKFSDERPIVDNSDKGLIVIDWPERLEDLGRIRKTAGSIPAGHDAAWLYGSGVVLKTQYLVWEETE